MSRRLRNSRKQCFTYPIQVCKCRDQGNGGVHSPFDLNGEEHPPLSATTIFPLGRGVTFHMGALVDPSKSKSLTQLNSSSGSQLTDYLVRFPPLSSEELIRLGEDLLYVCPVFYQGR